MKRILLASVVLAGVFGCKSGPVIAVKDPGPATLPQGAQTAESSDKTCSIMVAPGWKRGGPNSNVMGAMPDLSALGGENPDMAALAQGAGAEVSAVDAEEAAELEKKGILIWVNDSSRVIPGEARTNYRLRRKDDGPMSLEDAVEDAKQDILNEQVTYVELPIGKAGRMEAMTTKIDGGQLFQIVYVIVNGEHVYDLRFTTQNDPTSVKNIEKQVVESLRIKPAK